MKVRPKVRCIDNEVLAQCWLSFIGFSEEANHAKRQIFENEKWYEFVFLNTPKLHAAKYSYDLAKARDESVHEAPDPALMLCAYIAREFARQVVPTQKDSREQAMKRLGIVAAKSSREQIENALAGDSEYVINQVLSGMSFLFAEYLGYLIYSACGDKTSTSGRLLLKNGSFADLLLKMNFEDVSARVKVQDIKQGDILAVAWWSFRHCIEELAGGSWLTEYRQARSRNRFTYSATETRERLIKAFDSLNQYTEKAQLTRPWAIGIAPPNGLIGMIKKTLIK